MWERAIGNTFGATVFSSYGGFWICWALIETGGLGLIDGYAWYFLAGWFIFTTICLFFTLKSTLAFFSLFFLLDITFLLLTVAHLQQGTDSSLNAAVTKDVGIFGLITAFITW
ncbi:hypothetical protein L211DRAFT_851569 [Terfezia boudieri ATCC MYA-4762]|uniref:Uncharacterized protein n=1 Tax=Terfezia boudieri ATCC MYA-4762 TaxID=1051890 RepID=A0A3N4LI90_9PEZI|nr:hypothetical protein L211DRAFT_851569 [Terfezia boudieri ATCC MYA-4762]